ncbi:MAG: ParB-like nuclease domain-containing protein [Phycisphaeraceae bacterium]|nr:ParB-like nuclease domain-containing protein [Phycisphaeraceae bacterium]
MEIQIISLSKLHPHPDNCNVMSPQLLKKLAGHIKRSGRYPPLIVRPWAEAQSESQAEAGGAYQILDGHHRAAAIKQLGLTEARCLVWEVGDQEALILLGTLNRLQGRDDMRLRARLVAQLGRQMDLPRLEALLPERASELEALARFTDPPPPLRRPADLADMPAAVHFFLLPAEKRELEACLGDLGGTREQALLSLVRQRAAG